MTAARNAASAPPSTVELDHRHAMVPNGKGWLLPLERVVSPRHLDPSRRPVLLLPGYGMNGHIFGFSAGGRSMVQVLAESGVEVWRAAWRGIGGARPVMPKPGAPSLRAYAEEDLPALLRAVRERSSCSADRVDVVGASLGGAALYAHLALVGDDAIGAVVSLGTPLRWVTVHPLIRLAFSSRRLAGAVPMRGMDRFARALAPTAMGIPGLINLYMNPAHLDRSQVHELLPTVDRVSRRVNGELALWMRSRDLEVAGVHITKALGRVRRPLLAMHANRDGVVPPAVASSVGPAWGGDDVTVVEIGTQQDWYAHACLFMAPEAPALVFDPMARWLAERASCE